MARKSIHLYVSDTTWLALAKASALAPAAGIHAEVASADWIALGKSLRAHFAAPCKVQLVLSARQCRFLVLPWVSSCYTGGAIKAYVAEAFADANGVSADSHHVEIHWPRYGQPILAVAYPRALVDGVRAGLTAAGHELASACSSVGPVLRKYGRSLGPDPTLLAYAEDDGITAITIEGGQVAQVETLSGRGAGLDDVAIWSSRKRFGFAEDSQLRWLTTGPKPETFAGTSLAPVDIDKPATPGHALVAACL